MPECFSRRSGRAARRSWWISTVFVATGLTGCEPPPEPISIVPDSARGRLAIEALMETWKAGHRTGIIEATTPRIQVVDTHRKPGQKVVGFEILSDSADSRVRTYSVRLDLGEPEERPVVRFLAVGIDPILIFRQEDHELLMHWEHQMEPGPESGTSPPAPPKK